MDEIGVIHGRFQMLHNDHMAYLLEGKRRCRHLIVGICNPDKTLTRYSETDPKRASAASNPFTYYERFQMIQGAFLERGIKREEFDIVPFPINVPELLPAYVPMKARFYMTIYDAWGMEKKKQLEALGCDVDVMWQKNPEEKGITGTEVRRRLATGLPWRQLVPDFVYTYIMERGLEERVRSLVGEP